jgi:hypothetical protein
MVLITALAPRSQSFDANLNSAIDCHWQAQSVAIILFGYAQACWMVRDGRRWFGDGSAMVLKRRRGLPRLRFVPRTPGRRSGDQRAP